MNEWIKACRHLPTFAKLGQVPKTRILFANRRIRHVQKEEAGQRIGKCTLHAARRGPGTTRRIPKKKSEDPGSHQAPADYVQSASSTRESAAREFGARNQPGLFTRERKVKRKGNVPIVSGADRPGLLNLSMQKLLKRCRQRGGACFFVLKSKCTHG